MSLSPSEFVGHPSSRKLRGDGEILSEEVRLFRARPESERAFEEAATKSAVNWPARGPTERRPSLACECAPALAMLMPTLRCAGSRFGESSLGVRTWRCSRRCAQRPYLLLHRAGRREPSGRDQGDHADQVSRSLGHPRLTPYGPWRRLCEHIHRIRQTPWPPGQGEENDTTPSFEPALNRPFRKYARHFCVDLKYLKSGGA